METFATPWTEFYGDIPKHLDYKEETLYQGLQRIASEHPELAAYEFLGLRVPYAQFLAEVDSCAAGLYHRGIRKGDRVTVCLPNIPQCMIVFYALNKLSAISSMIHPLSASEEIHYYLKISNSKAAVTLDAFYPRFQHVLKGTPARMLILTKMTDHMTKPIATVFRYTKGRKIAKVPLDLHVVWWKQIMKVKTRRLPEHAAEPLDAHELAVILYSGGTTGMPKGIMLSSMNLNCLSEQVSYQQGDGSEKDRMKAGDSVLAILPMFHGFGLGACVHAFVHHGGKVILVPQFSADAVAKILKKNAPSVMAGVPTLYEALLNNPSVRKADLSALKGVYGGGDTVPLSIKNRFDELLAGGGSNVQLREGYGLTETVTVCTVMPASEYRQNSIGIPLPDMLAKVVEPGTQNEVPVGEDGELCIYGPTMMLGYLDSPEETAEVIQRHEDGRDWVHTGDMVSMDADGFIYFKLRIKRMIKVSGISVYPTQTERILDSHPDVNMCCVIGIPDAYQMSILKAFVVLHDENKETRETEQELISYCRERINKFSCPKSIEFRSDLPMTRVGKIAFTELEKEEIARASHQEDVKRDLIEEREKNLS